MPDYAERILMSGFGATRPFFSARGCVISIAVAAGCSIWPQVGAAQDSSDADPALVLEAGAAGERSSREGVSNFGATLAVEATPIEEWLELEFGVTALAASGHTEVSSDLMFKKPFRLSPTSEFMIGLGPTVARTLSGPEKGTSHGIEVVLDFMFWRDKRTGWYVEPGWSRNAGSGERSFSINGGLLFGWH
jgi:hypothetical protein